MLHFNESFVGGFFGSGRTYGAVARLACETATDFEADWQEALRQTAAWRARRPGRATALHIHLLVPTSLAWDAMAFAAARVIVPPASLPEELRGLGLTVLVFDTPDMELFMNLVLYPEATSKGRKATDSPGFPGRIEPVL
jgi:hypothetical protein